MRYYKKSLFFVFCALILFSLGSTVYAAEEDHSSLADYLKEIGLFQGTDTGYNLMSTTNRAEAAVMVVRLLGKKEEALASNYPHPFTDVPTWASPYVGYLYEKGISKGMTEDTYGADELLSGLQYMTFLLRLLNYDDATGEFTWKESIEKAYDLGILDASEYRYYQNNQQFLRDDLVLFTYDILDGDVKDSLGKSFLRKLMDEAVVPQNAMIEYKYAPYNISLSMPKVSNLQEFEDTIIEGIVNYKDVIEINISDLVITDIKDMINGAIDQLIVLPGYASVVTSWNADYSGEKCVIKIQYLITKKEFERAMSAAQNVASQLMAMRLSDYERELLIHDYIVDNNQYYQRDNGPGEIYTLYGIFIDHSAVCQGYADAFFYLTTYAGIESALVYGTGLSDTGSELHAWNLVQLEGENYLIDTTWDDPVTDDNVPTKVYTYFNVTDKTLAMDHEWVLADYPRSDGTKYNYYVYNRMMVSSEKDLITAMENGFNERKTELIFKTTYQVTEASIKSILDTMRNYSKCLYSVDETNNLVQIKDIHY